MKLYYINRFPNQDGTHQLHTANCNQLANIFYRICLGTNKTQEEALLEANKKYPKTTYCPNCLNIQYKPQKPKPFFKRWFRKK